MKKAHLFLLSLIIFLFWNNGLTGQEIPLRFEHLSTRDGLSNNRVTSIFKDKLGYTWLGTISGLNRYNGYDFTVFKYESGNRNSINNNTIIWIAEGPSDNLWIKTGNGLQGFNIYSERFVDVSRLLTDAHIDIWNVNKIIKDQNQNYWLAVQDHGVYKIVNEDSVMAVNEGENANLTDISFDLSGNLMVLHDDGKIQNININTHKVIGTWYLKGLEKKSYTLNFFIDGSGSLWIWSKSIPIGLFYYDQIGSDPRIIGKKELSSILVSEVVQDEVGNIIVATDHGGITIISKSDWTYQNYRNNITDDKSLSHDSAISAYRDVDGVIWIGTNKGGVNFYHPKKNYFKYFYYQGDDPSIHNDIK